MNILCSNTFKNKSGSRAWVKNTAGPWIMSFYYNVDEMPLKPMVKLVLLPVILLKVTEPMVDFKWALTTWKREIEWEKNFSILQL